MQVTGAGAAGQAYATNSSTPRAAALKTLTDSDRAFIAQTTGVDVTADAIVAPAVAWDIAYDRAAGRLTGDINRAYAEGLLSNARQSAEQQANDVDRGRDFAAAADASARAADFYQQWWQRAQEYFQTPAQSPERLNAEL